MEAQKGLILRRHCEPDPGAQVQALYDLLHRDTAPGNPEIKETNSDSFAGRALLVSEQTERPTPGCPDG